MLHDFLNEVCSKIRSYCFWEKIACFSWGVLFGISENITNQISGSGVKLMEENLQKNASGIGKDYKSSEWNWSEILEI